MEHEDRPQTGSQSLRTNELETVNIKLRLWHMAKLQITYCSVCESQGLFRPLVSTSQSLPESPDAKILPSDVLLFFFFVSPVWVKIAEQKLTTRHSCDMTQCVTQHNFLLKRSILWGFCAKTKRIGTGNTLY